MKKKGVQSLAIAKAGIEDAIYEIRENNTWDEASLTTHAWKKVSNQTYEKSTALGSLNPDLFDYPATFSVTVSGDPSVDTLNITSVSQIDSTGEEYEFTKTLFAQVIQTASGEVYILNIQEL